MAAYYGGFNFGYSATYPSFLKSFIRFVINIICSLMLITYRVVTTTMVLDLILARMIIIALMMTMEVISVDAILSIK